MSSLTESGYKHWDGHRHGINYRRSVIAFHGIRSCLQVKWMRHIVGLAWIVGLAGVALMFAIGQLLVADSIVVSWLENLNPQLQAFATSLIVWLEQHPEISVRTTQNVLFYFFSTSISTLSFIAVAIALPHLVSRDLASNAIIVYSTKAVGRFDYVLGKFSTLFGILTLTWLGPTLVMWFMGNLLAPSGHFFWHSRLALGHLVFYIVSSMVFLSIFGLGVSAFSSRERSVVAAWVAIWLFGNAFVPIGMQTKPWLKHFSFSFNLDQVALAIFKLNADLKLAQDNVPILGNLLRQVNRQTKAIWQNPEINGAIIGLGVMALIAVFVIWKRVRPE